VAKDLESQIRKALWEYASNCVSLYEFRSRFVPLSWDIEASHDPAAIKLAHHIDGILAEASTAGWTEEQLHEELRGSVAAMPFAEDVVGDPSPFSIPQCSAELATNRAVAA